MQLKPTYRITVVCDDPGTTAVMAEWIAEMVETQFHEDNEVTRYHGPEGYFVLVNKDEVAR